ncbi:WD40 repeat-like protein [Aureobasidium subglaciale]|nr:WD40 repeat-like protein [Aureobasidium subglaciale]KAI5274948.1 WD40 repeat-like protein [Aureobasidium subglaciale]
MSRLDHVRRDDGTHLLFDNINSNVMSAQFPTRPISRLTGHNGQVLALCYSAGTGQYLLTGSTDRHVRLFNPATGLEVQKYSAHGYEVHDISVAQDNDRFISVGGDKTVFLWDVTTHQTLRRWSGHAGRINACAFAGEGDSLVVTGSFDSTVKIWDCKQRGEKPIMSLPEAKDAVSSISVSGAEILAGSVDGRVRCYDVRMGVVDQDVLSHPVTSVTPTVNNDSYLASTLDSTLRLMDKRDGKLLQAFRDPGFKNTNYRLRSTLAAGDGLAISGSEDGHIYVWDLLTGTLAHKLKHSAPALADGSKSFVSMSSKRDVVNTVVWNQLRKEWASAGGDGSVVVWGA